MSIMFYKLIDLLIIITLAIPFQCLKESYVKALGIGIGFTLQRLDFHVTSEVLVGRTVCDTQVYVDGTLQQDWRFEETMLDDKHGVAVALNKKVDTFGTIIPHL